MASRYKIYTGRNLSLEKYLRIWNLDNQTFKEEDLLPREKGIKWFEYSDRSILALWDIKEDKLIGYIYPFLFERDFAENYIKTDAKFQTDIVKSSFAKPKRGANLSVYIFSTVIESDYRDKILWDEDSSSKFHNKKAFKILNEAFVDWLCKVIKKGVNLDYVISEIVSKDGLKYVTSLGLSPCSNKKAENKYADNFNPLMFHRCANVQKLIKANSKIER